MANPEVRLVARRGFSCQMERGTFCDQGYDGGLPGLLVQENTSVHTANTACTGCGTELIDSVLEHGPQIFDLTLLRPSLYSNI